MTVIMLCGAADVRDFLEAFSETVTEIGGQPWSYLNGTLRSWNNGDASYPRNSELSLAAADLCVFVINRDFGKITWGVEMERVLQSKRHFLLLAHEETWRDYQAMKKHGSTLKLVADENTRSLFRALASAEARELTIIPFKTHTFKETLRAGFSRMLQDGLQSLAHGADNDGRWSRLVAERDELSRQVHELGASRMGDGETIRRLEGELRESTKRISSQRRANDELSSSLRRAAESNSRHLSELARRSRFPKHLVAVSLAMAFILGAIPSWFIGRQVGQRISVDQHLATIAPPGPSTAPLQSPTTSRTPSLRPLTYTKRQCGRPVLRLATMTDQSIEMQEIRATFFAQDFAYRIGYIKRRDQVYASLGADYCTTGPKWDANIILWTGYFDSIQEASATCDLYKRRGVSVYCAASS